MSKGNKYQIYQEASLSQKLADKDPIFKEISGTDQDIANAIGMFIVFGKLPEFYLYLILFVTGYAFRESIEKELEQE